MERAGPVRCVWFVLLSLILGGCPLGQDFSGYELGTGATGAGAAPSGGGTSGAGGTTGGTSAVGGTAGTSAGGGTGATGGTASGGGGLPSGGGAPSGGGGTGGATCTPPAAGGECDTFPPCGCSGSYACSVDPATQLTKCIVPGAIAPYDACATTSECAAGSACFLGTCKRFCEETSDCLSTAGMCIKIGAPGIEVCTKKCKLENPLADCGSGLTCIYVTSGYTDCAKPGNGDGQVGCTSPLQCKLGYGCSAAGACRKNCRIGYAAQDCPSGKTCDQVAGPTIDGFTYGLCSL